MMATIDGKIDSGIAGFDILENYFSLYTECESKLAAQAWMCGRVTLRMFAAGEYTPLPPSDDLIDETDYFAPHSQKRYMFGIDPKGVLRWEKNTVQLTNVEPLHLVIVVTRETPKQYLSYLRSLDISYIIAGNTRAIDIPLLLKKIHEDYHVGRLLLEGGGSWNGSMMDAGAVDEISYILTPMVLNRKAAPAVFDAERVVSDTHKFIPSDVQNLEQGALWIRYKKTA
jgi:riboflavin biosynthesis pyrimidine reductase